LDHARLRKRNGRKRLVGGDHIDHIDARLIDRIMSILTDSTATDAERDAAAIAAAPFFHEELTMEVSNTQWAIYLSL
jgi:hypothetical protein